MQMDIYSKAEAPDVEEMELMPLVIEQLEKITALTLIIIGDKDVAAFKSISDLIARNVRNSKYLIMQRTAHLPSMDTPNEFNRTVLDFLKSKNLPYEIIER